MAAEVRYVRNVFKQHVHKTISGSKDCVEYVVSLDQASTSVDDALFKVALSVADHAIC